MKAAFQGIFSKYWKHILFWTAYISYECSLLYFSGIPIPFFKTIIFFSINIFFVYGISNLILKKEKLELFVGIITFVALFIVLKTLLEYFFELRFSIIGQVMRSFHFLLMGIGYGIYKKSEMMHEAKLKLISEINLYKQNEINSEKDLIALQYKLLKAQINPHFIFNTLSYLYTSTHKLNSNVSDSIYLLTTILRHTLANDSSFSKLSEELNYIKDYIEINKLRNPNIFINLDIELNSSEDILIPKLLLATLIENIYKHGDISIPDASHISIKLENDRLIYLSENPLKADIGKELQSSKLGSTYIASALERNYNKYIFKSEAVKGKYFIQLEFSDHDKLFDN